MKIERFLCNGETRCIQVEKTPRFSWRITGRKPQIAYQLTVFDAENCVYDSGKIESKSKNHTADFLIDSCKEYRARLAVYTDKERVEEERVFRSALVRGFDESAKWISAPSLSATDGGNPASYFKKEFTVEKTDSAFIYCAGLGLYEIRVNGNAITDEVLAQPFTNYAKKIFYGVYEITKYIKLGLNVVEVTLADGWYNQNAKDTWRFWQAEWKDTNKFIFQMQYGSETLVSNESWDVSTDGVITRSAIRLGETHDLRRAPSYAQKAVQVCAPTGTVTARVGNPIKEKERFSYVKAWLDSEGVLFDFGHNLSGYISLNITAKDGETFEITYGERVKDGKIDNESNSQYIRDEEQRPFYQKDYLICREGENYFKPKFVYHGFQYAYIKGLTYIPKKTEITAHWVYTDFCRTGRLNIENARVMRLQKMVLASDKANYVGIPTDCPHREKNGWTGDMQASAEQYIYNFDMQEDMRKWLLDILDCQTEDGAVPCIVPTARNIFGYAWGTGPAWDFAFFEITYQLVKKYDDTDILQKVYPYLEKYYAYLENKKDEQGLLCVGLGDWCYPRDIKFPIAPTRLTDSLYFYKMSQYLAYFSMRLFGQEKDYTNKANEMKLAVDKEFLGENGKVANDSITALAAYLYFLAPDEKTDALITARLVKEIRKRKYGSFFGILGNKYLHRVLFERELGDISIKIWERDEYPSFGYWLRRGAVNMLEDFEDRLSRNHHMFGDISAVFYSCIVGVDYSIENGIVRLEVKIPKLKRIKNASATVDTPNGKIRVSWSKKKGKIYAKISSPVDVVGTICYQQQTFDLVSGKTATYEFATN